MLHFEALSFDALTRRQLYALLQLRCEVFVVEQDCTYQDLDGLDFEARHLLGTEEGELKAYARWFWREEPDPHGGHDSGPAVVLGRIVTARSARGMGAGRRLMEAALETIEADGPQRIRMHAQAYLQDFYRRLGFATQGEPFDQDGIPHVLMVRKP